VNCRTPNIVHEHRCESLKSHGTVGIFSSFFFFLFFLRSGLTYCRLTVREVADEVGSSIGSCHQIFTEKFQLRRVSAKFVPRLLIDDQKENRVEISQELLTSANGNGNFLKNIITGDGTWACGCDVETKIQSSQWMGKGSP